MLKLPGNLHYYSSIVEVVQDPTSTQENYNRITPFLLFNYGTRIPEKYSEYIKEGLSDQ